jgi:predicted Zn-ribbon and HTH transcriptional regulator
MPTYFRAIKREKAKIHEHWYSHSICYDCGYHLEANMPLTWAEQTRCPKCAKSFLD